MVGIYSDTCIEVTMAGLDLGKLYERHLIAKRSRVEVMIIEGGRFTAINRMDMDCNGHGLQWANRVLDSTLWTFSTFENPCPSTKQHDSKMDCSRGRVPKDRNSGVKTCSIQLEFGHQESENR